MAQLLDNIWKMIFLFTELFPDWNRKFQFITDSKTKQKINKHFIPMEKSFSFNVIIY